MVAVQVAVQVMVMVMVVVDGAGSAGVGVTAAGLETDDGAAGVTSASPPQAAINPQTSDAQRILEILRFANRTNRATTVPV